MAAPKYLYREIQDNLATSAIGPKSFMPRDALEKVMSRESIERELKRKRILSDKLLDFIFERAKRVFAILVRLRMINAAEDLPAYEFTDEYLPVDVVHGENKGEQPRVTSLNVKTPSKDPLEWFQTKSWEEHQAFDFCEIQWLFLAPVFTEEQVEHDLHPKCPVPFTKKSEKIGGGGFSNLFHGCIHPAHQTLLPQENEDGSQIAIKELLDLQVNTENVVIADPEKAYRVEVDVLYMVRKMKHPHLIKFVTAYKQDNKRYLIFEWADGGNLREFWCNFQHPTRTEKVITWALKQMLGLAGAINILHNSTDTGVTNCRHGDLKPENIVRHSGGDGWGTLQIADMGLAKVHDVVTRLRNKPTVTVSGTDRYQPPETDLYPKRPRSRAYDMWSMGCIYLEFIIWILYGPEELIRFNKSFKESFFTTEIINSIPVVRLQDEVENWVDWMKKQSLHREDNRCLSNALRDLLDLVYDRLLIQDQEPEMDPTVPDEAAVGLQLKTPIVIVDPVDTLAPAEKPKRAKSQELYEKLGEIVAKTKSSLSYIHNRDARIETRGPDDLSKETDPPKITGFLNTPHPGHDGVVSPQGAPEIANTKHPLNNDWDHVVDNGFATRIFSQIEASGVLPQHSTVSSLCSYCTNIWDRDFFINNRISEIEAKSLTCGLCKIFYETSIQLGKKSDDYIQFFRKGSSFVTHLHSPPILSILAGPGLTTVPAEIQRGFPKLPEAGSETQMKLLREWIRYCDNDKTHECRPKGERRLPMRLLDVGDGKSPDLLRLDCSGNRGLGSYVALSHRWGDMKLHPPFCTYRSNIDEFQKKIGFEDLPKTFQDAVIVTRALGVRYLWIDSLCIIQQDDDDWRKESKRMEEVFSGAYCTIAASRADGTHAGILGPRPERRCTALQKESEPPFYICTTIDDFRSDVEMGQLNRRGWVFQEKALSRRSIYFTENQVYWECGHGVRCETLTKLYNLKSSFLADPDFPQSAERYYKGMKIRFFEILYEQYSKLDFTHITDRSVGMAGLEKRLAKVYKTPGEFGVLDQFLHRSLLWQNLTGQPMHQIPYEKDRTVPSWSWMAFEGPIKYMDIPFNGVNWSSDIRSPFKNRLNVGAASQWHSPSAEFEAVARDFAFVPGQGNGELIFDRPGGSNKKPWKPKCVIVATQKLDRLTDAQDHYVLLVMPTHAADNCREYERIGVAVMEKKHIAVNDRGLVVRIV